MLEVVQLNAHYGLSHVLHDVALSVPPSQVTAVIGRNGVAGLLGCALRPNISPMLKYFHACENHRRQHSDSRYRRVALLEEFPRRGGAPRARTGGFEVRRRSKLAQAQ